MSENLPAPRDAQVLIYQSDAGEVRLEVRLQDETVWLTQNQMAELYQTTKQNVSLHIQNVYEEGELAPEATVKEYLTVRQEGSRAQCRTEIVSAVARQLALDYRIGFSGKNLWRTIQSADVLPEKKIVVALIRQSWRRRGNVLPTG